MKGIDVSEHNGTLNWDQIKASGIEFAMLRASWGHFVEDKQLRRNIEECLRIQMPYGLYHYSYASTDNEASQEANSFLALAQTFAGRSYPLCLDMEDADGWKVNNGVNDAQNLRTIQIFKDIIEGADEYLTLYMSKSWFDCLRSQNAVLIDSLDAWLAHWGIASPSMACGMWQYTSDGIVKGSSQRTDMNISYKDYPSLIHPKAKPSPPSKPPIKPSQPHLQIGAKVKLRASAQTYATGEDIPDWVKAQSYTILQISDGKVLLEEIVSWVKQSDLENQIDTSPALYVGMQVRLKPTASKYATGETIPDWVKQQAHTILQIGNDKLLLEEIMSWVYRSDIL